MTVKGEAEPDIPLYTADPVQVTPSVQGQGQGTAPMVSATVLPVQVEPKQPEMATVDVIAPTNMAAGYQFNVDAGGKQLRVAVPPGGVVAGQRFAAIILSENVTAGGGQNPHNIPTGRWRDDLCDCCKFGCCHAMCCLACWFTTCAIAQPMTRLGLNWLASPLSGNSTTMSTFRIVFIITCVYTILNSVLGAFVDADTDNDDFYNQDNSSSPSGVEIVQDVLGVVFGLYALIIVCKTRSFVRNKYNIPTKCCGDCEDCCCSFWCAPCTTCQIARHITDYNNYGANCCSDNGLQAGTPDMV